MAEKQKPCCARQRWKLQTVQADLARVARKASNAAAKGRPTDVWVPRIAECKRLIAMAEQNVVNHEAEHAGEPE